MKNSLLEKICIWMEEDTSFFKMSDAEANFLGDIDELYTHFCHNLKGDDNEKFKKLCNFFDGVVCEEAEAYFRMGFKFALKLAAECFV